jgi:hypothetical protein
MCDQHDDRPTQRQLGVHDAANNLPKEKVKAYKNVRNNKSLLLVGR